MYLFYPRYYLKGTNKGKWEVAVDGLPGAPDNIKVDKQGNMYVSLVMARDSDTPNIAVDIGKYPLLRKFLARILALTQDGVEIFDHFFPNSVLKRTFYNVSLNVDNMDFGLNFIL